MRKERTKDKSKKDILLKITELEEYLIFKNDEIIDKWDELTDIDIKYKTCIVNYLLWVLDYPVILTKIDDKEIVLEVEEEINEYIEEILKNNKVKIVKEEKELYKVIINK